MLHRKLCYIIGIFFFLCLGTHQVFGQYLPWFTQYRTYRSVINPAALRPAFTEDLGYYNLGFDLSVKNEGSSIGGIVPQTLIAQASWVPEKNSYRTFNLLFGGYLMSDKFDLTQYNNTFFRIGVFTSEIPKLGVFSLGFNVGLNQFRIKADPDDFLVSPDITLNNSASFFNLGFGVFYNKKINYNPNTGAGHDIYFGFSVPYLRQFELVFADTSNATQRSFDLTQHYFLLGANLYLSDYGFIEPSVWLKKLRNNQMEIDFNLRYRFRQPFWIGAGISTQETIHLEFGIHIWDMKFTNGRIAKTRSPFLKIGFGYDKGFGKIPGFIDDSFEINLTYLIPSLKQ